MGNFYHVKRYENSENNFFSFIYTSKKFIYTLKKIKHNISLRVNMLNVCTCDKLKILSSENGREKHKQKCSDK